MNAIKMDIELYRVKNCPRTAYYVPNFITEIEESLLISNIYKTPKTKWTQLSNRRLLNFGGVPHAKGMIAEDIPVWLVNFLDKINKLDLFDENKTANHVLVNEYLPGQGIMPHTDGPIFFPTISTISCSSHTILEFTEQNLDGSSPINRNIICKLLIEPRSLLILKHDLYQKYLHSISETTEDVIDESIENLENCKNKYKIGDTLQRDTRVSLTIRNVPKTTKWKLNSIKK